MDLGKLALRIAERHGTNADRWYVFLAWLPSIPNVFFSRSLVMYCSMVSAYENVHIRSNLPRLEEATKYANSAGDRCAIHFQKVIYMSNVKFAGCIQASRISIPYKPSCSLANRVCDFAFWSESCVSDERVTGSSGRTCCCGRRDGDVFSSIFFLSYSDGSSYQRLTMM